MLKHGAILEANLFQLNENTIRVIFASEEPNVRQTEFYYIDFDFKTQCFENDAHRLQIRTESGIEDMTSKAILGGIKRLGYVAGVELEHAIHVYKKT